MPSVSEAGGHYKATAAISARIVDRTITGQDWFCVHIVSGAPWRHFFTRQPSQSVMVAERKVIKLRWHVRHQGHRVLVKNPHRSLDKTIIYRLRAACLRSVLTALPTFRSSALLLHLWLGCTLRQPGMGGRVIGWGKKWDTSIHLNHSFYGTLINPTWEMSNVVSAAVTFAYQCNLWLNRCWQSCHQHNNLLLSKIFKSFCSKISINVLYFLSFPKLLITPYLVACVIALYFPLLNHA